MTTMEMDGMTFNESGKNKQDTPPTLYPTTTTTTTTTKVVQYNAVVHFAFFFNSLAFCLFVYIFIRVSCLSGWEPPQDIVVGRY